MDASLIIASILESVLTSEYCIPGDSWRDQSQKSCGKAEARDATIYWSNISEGNRTHDLLYSTSSRHMRCIFSLQIYLEARLHHDVPCILLWVRGFAVEIALVGDRIVQALIHQVLGHIDHMWGDIDPVAPATPSILHQTISDEWHN